jgi:hypothetical protein
MSSLEQKEPRCKATHGGISCPSWPKTKSGLPHTLLSTSNHSPLPSLIRNKRKPVYRNHELNYIQIQCHQTEELP